VFNHTVPISDSNFVAPSLKVHVDACVVLLINEDTYEAMTKGFIVFFMNEYGPSVMHEDHWMDWRMNSCHLN
jgi:hypothetical protein